MSLEASWNKSFFLRYGPVVLGLIAGVTFSIVTYFVFVKLENNAAESTFRQRAASVISAVRSGTEADIAIVSSVASFYHSSDDVTREDFHSFVFPLLADNPSIQALEWAPRITGAEREAYERAAGAELQRSLSITEQDDTGRSIPAGPRGEYFPVLYLEPYLGNEAALGFDLGSESRRAAVLMAARDSGRIRASGPIQLVQDHAEQHGILLAAPVYVRVGATYRQMKLKGFVLGVIRVKDLLARTTAPWESGATEKVGTFDLYLYDEGQRGADRLLAAHRTTTPDEDPPYLSEYELHSGVQLTETFNVAGQSWRLVVRPVGGVIPTSKQWVPLASLLVGLAFTASLATILLINANRSRVQDQLVELRTTELAAIRDQLRVDSVEREAAQATLRELSQITKYLSPQIYESISAGQRTVQIASQHKKLTVFFADLVEFTKLVDLLAPEDVTQLLNQYLTEMSHIGMQYGGTIDKYIGDGIMMFYGDPESKGVKEDALQCVRMATAMQKRMGELYDSWEALGVRNSPRCRMGISTGYCMVGNFGCEERMEYTIVGSGVNLASRLEEAAAPGSILISYETYALVKEEFRCEELPPLVLKGVREPVHNYRVIGDWENTPEAESVIRADLPSLKLEVNLRTLTNGDREQVVAALRQALQRLSSGDTA